MKEMPLVSVVVPCYNHEKYVQDCIRSIIDQAYDNIELIIIDDGSTDGSVKKIEQMIDVCKQRFVRFEFRHRANKGLCATLNEALAWCQGVYYSVIASDDMMLPEKTALQVDFLESHTDVSVLCTNMYFFNDDKILKTTNIKAKVYEFNEIFLNNKILAPTHMCRMDVIRFVGGYDENVMIEDWYMWLKILDHGFKISSITNVLVKYRWHGSNTSSNQKKMLIGKKQILDLYHHKKIYKVALFLHNIRQTLFDLYYQKRWLKYWIFRFYYFFISRICYLIY